MDMEIYIGPYVRIKQREVSVEIEETICPECRKVIRSNFCPKCGSKIEIVKNTKPQKEILWDILSDNWEDYLFYPTSLDDIGIPNGEIGAFPDDTTYAKIDTKDMEDKIKEFENKYYEIIQFLRLEGYDPVVEYGYVCWYDY